MAIRLHNKNLDNQKDSELHLMPCKIHGDESAKVSSFFKPYIREIDNEHYYASFRGYPLEGKKVIIPAEYKGITFIENKKAENTENKDRHLYSTGTFSQFTYWNYDRIPSKNDALARALDWIDIAEALHSPET